MVKKVKKYAFGGMPTAANPTNSQKPVMPQGLATAAQNSGRDFSGIAGGKFAPPPTSPTVANPVTPAPAPTGTMQQSYGTPDLSKLGIQLGSNTTDLSRLTSDTTSNLDPNTGFVTGDFTPQRFKKGGKVKAKAPVKKYAKGGSVSSASKRADGIATKGKTRGRMI